MAFYFERIAQAEQRPPRRYYKLTRAGQELLLNAGQRYRLPELAETDRK